MSEATAAIKGLVEKDDKAALEKQEEAVHVATQWAQEKIDNFLLEIELVTTPSLLAVLTTSIEAVPKILSCSISAISFLDEPLSKFSHPRRAASVISSATPSKALWTARLLRV